MGTKLNQRERAEVAIVSGDVSMMRDVLYQAQNDPPLGESDGSMSPDQWMALRKLLDRHKNLVDARREASKLFDIKMSHVIPEDSSDE